MAYEQSDERIGAASDLSKRFDHERATSVARGIGRFDRS
jgi:hypothetical protein